MRRIPWPVARLSELLALNLGISKTRAARLIEDGRIGDARGDVYTDRRAEIEVVDAQNDGDDRAAGIDVRVPVVMLDGEPLSLWQRALVLLHKPVGVVTALRDPIHPTAYQLLRQAPLFAELRPAGRLDLDTSGLLLWTTEGALIQRLTHPKRRVPRTYQAALARPFVDPWSAAELVLEDGHRPEVLELKESSPADAHPGLIIPAGTATLATITIVGGAYHEVRRIFAALDSHVLALCRVQFGSFTLPVDLPAGGWRQLPFPPGA